MSRQTVQFFARKGGRDPTASVNWWYLLRGLGVVTSPPYPACARMTANWFPSAHPARLQGFILCGAALGSAITPVALTRLISLYGWRTSFHMAAAATGLVAGLWFLTASPSRQSRPRSALARLLPSQLL